MNIGPDGAEIDGAKDFEVYGEWIKFTDGEGSTVKITPSVVAPCNGSKTAITRWITPALKMDFKTVAW